MILEKIKEKKREEIRQLLLTANVAHMKKKILELPPARDFRKALYNQGQVSLIAEIKKASPSKGLLCPNFDHRQLAHIYQSNGAAALSVLTDENFFLGKLTYLEEIKQQSSLPLLRKDFILDPVQLYQSRLAGADAVLLIAGLLTPGELSQLFLLCREIGMQALVEVHTQEELQRVLTTDAKLIGINNRDLSTFQTNLATTAKLLEQVQIEDITIVSESGIAQKEDIKFLKSLGVHGVLVGEALVTAQDIAKKVQEIVVAGGRGEA
ncbi:indole-3-glycerol phosphate synthase [Desulforamulus reducens MI-1]|uniref:Indole-3-glycerol phosphate synthase n=1 Tax=Desulforamulus reducens (strain ATCC BAA-1160 / DSM 100696 / MI-1) TaxID=349161 RepID=TRPC_DESRM|nr:indole-3-glycerol phosphate synthase TrpC [Desulforamulus reducens]A4J147.1 RecName: Full=Indole-3-glycerol phosphate synthase; Short=IGPS [Desulforamulus reducens MI-1]ABO48800.1 indole-3-glycerol phosphate synthase [Desulforamulus reducens MI-1]